LTAEGSRRIWQFLSEFFLHDSISHFIFLTFFSPQTDAFIVPEPPAVPEVGEMILQGASSNLAELGLATYWPPGLMRMTFDYIHLTFDIPWWGTIALGNHEFCIISIVENTIDFPNS
jgi:hypothetical protein